MLGFADSKERRIIKLTGFISVPRLGEGKENFRGMQEGPGRCQCRIGKGKQGSEGVQIFLVSVRLKKGGRLANDTDATRFQEPKRNGGLIENLFKVGYRKKKTR